MLSENDNSLLDASESDSVSVCLLQAVLLISVTCYQQIIISSKVSHSDLLSIKQRKHDKKMKRFTNYLDSDFDHTF